MTRPTRDDVAEQIKTSAEYVVGVAFGVPQSAQEQHLYGIADAVMPLLNAAHDRLAQAWNEGFDRGYEVGYNDASDPDAPSFQRNNPYPLARDAALAGDDS